MVFWKSIALGLYSPATDRYVCKVRAVIDRYTVLCEFHMCITDHTNLLGEGVSMACTSRAQSTESQNRSLDDGIMEECCLLAPFGLLLSYITQARLLRHGTAHVGRASYFN